MRHKYNIDCTTIIFQLRMQPVLLILLIMHWHSLVLLSIDIYIEIIIIDIMDHVRSKTSNIYMTYTYTVWIYKQIIFVWCAIGKLIV